MQALKIVTVAMGIMIVVGVTVLVVLIAQRLAGNVPHAAGNAPTSVLLDEPAGTHIARTSLSGQELSVLLQGGGADRVVVLDLRSGRIVARAALAH